MNAHNTSGVASVYGGGPIYNNPSASIDQLRESGFTEVVVWNIAIDDSGTLNFNYEFPLVENGAYIGDRKHPDFVANMSSLKQSPTSVTRLTFSIGSSNVGVFQAIEKLVNEQGTGPDSILYRNFQVLRTTFQDLDAIDFDDENCYDHDSIVQFAVMLGELGFDVTLCPYTNSSFWQGVAASVNQQRAGTVTAVHLQCYSGGGGNSPCQSEWNFGDVPVWPGLSNTIGDGAVQSLVGNWAQSCSITGAFIWIFDDFYTQPGASRGFAEAIESGLSDG